MTLWRLGIDLGTNSLGWTAFELDPSGKEVERVLDMGVRIFSDGRNPENGKPNAVERRAARGVRRNRDRRIQRVQALVKYLRGYGLLPEDETKRREVFLLNPYAARAASVTGPVSKETLGRALFHLGLRRGFKSNRKTDDPSEGDGKKKLSELKQRMVDFEETLHENGQTLGQYLNERRDKVGLKEKIRFDGSWNFFPTRALYETEFHVIKARQSGALSEDQWRVLHEIIFDQRPLKEQEIGKCTFFPEEERAYKALPIAEESRILQELNALRYVNEDGELLPLSKEQRDRLFDLLQTQKSIAFSKVKTAAGLSKSAQFTIEGDSKNKKTAGKDKLIGNETAITLQGILGGKWEALGEKGQNDLVRDMVCAKDDEEIQSYLKALPFSLSQEEENKLLSASLKKGVGAVSRKFLERLVPILRSEVLTYDKAVMKVQDDRGNYLHHSQFGTGEVFERLPYYGKVLEKSVMGRKPEADPLLEPEEHYGKIANPSVHVALKQLQRVVNRLVDHYGTPAQIHLEVGSELKKSREAKDKIANQNKLNQKTNERIDTLLKEIGIYHPGRDDRTKYKLFEELSQCVYCGKQVSLQTGNWSEFEIEHILPFSKTFDDSFFNKTLACRSCNLKKSGRSPFDAFGHTDKWEGILGRVNVKDSGLHAKKRWRFNENALHLWEEQAAGRLSEKEVEDMGVSGDAFIARQLTDNQYIARIAKAYLESLVGPNRVLTIPGQMTAIVRSRLKFDRLLTQGKDRSDHRHHAIDGAVVGLTTRGLLQDISTQSARLEEAGGNKGRVFVRNFLDSETYNALRLQLKEKLEQLCVSYKPDHGLEGPMFNETTYSAVSVDANQDEDNRGANVVARTPLLGLNQKQLNQIRDLRLRRAVQDEVGELEGTALKKKLEEFSRRTRIKRVRLLETVETYPIASAPYKRYARGEFAFCEVWLNPVFDKKTKAVRKREALGFFVAYDEAGKLKKDKAYQANLDKRAREELKLHPTARKLMRLFKNDCVLLRLKPNSQNPEIAKKIEKLRGQFAPDKVEWDSRQADADPGYKGNSVKDLRPHMQSLQILEDGTHEWRMKVYGYSTTRNKLDVGPLSQAKHASIYISLNVLVNEYGMQRLLLDPSGKPIRDWKAFKKNKADSRGV